MCGSRSSVLRGSSWQSPRGPMELGLKPRRAAEETRAFPCTVPRTGGARNPEMAPDTRTVTLNGIITLVTGHVNGLF